jgi:hypothetical protein
MSSVNRISLLDFPLGSNSMQQWIDEHHTPRPAVLASNSTLYLDPTESEFVAPKTPPVSTVGISADVMSHHASQLNDDMILVDDYSLRSGGRSHSDTRSHVSSRKGYQPYDLDAWHKRAPSLKRFSRHEHFSSTESVLSHLPPAFEGPSRLEFPSPGRSFSTEASSTLGSPTQPTGALPQLKKRTSFVDAIRPRRLSQSSAVLKSLFRRSRVNSLLTSIPQEHDESSSHPPSPLKPKSLSMSPLPRVDLHDDGSPSTDMFPNLKPKEQSRSRATSISSLSSLSSWSRRKRPKKKLVVSGIETDEPWKVEGLRRWCEVSMPCHSISNVVHWFSHSRILEKSKI